MSDQRVQELEAEIARLKAERLKLDRRIHNQRVALRTNWEISEMRNSYHHRHDVRSRNLAAALRWRDRAEAAEAKLRQFD